MSKKDRDALSKKMKSRWSAEQTRAENRLYQVEHHPERYPSKYED